MPKTYNIPGLLRLGIDDVKGAYWNNQRKGSKIGEQNLYGGISGC